jgi:hypothetical protein
MPNIVTDLVSRVKRAFIPLAPADVPRFIPINAPKKVKKVSKKQFGGSTGWDLRTPTNKWATPRLPFRLLRDVAIRIPRIMACVGVIVRDSYRAGFGLEMEEPGRTVPSREINAWADFLKLADPAGRTFKDVLHSTFFDLETLDFFILEIVKNGFGQVQFIRRIDPTSIDRVETDKYGDPVRFIQNVNGNQIVLLPSQVIWGNKYFKGAIYGLSPVIPLWEQAGLYLFAISANGDSFEFSKTPKGLLILPQVSDRFWAEFKAERKAMENGQSINRILEMRGVVNSGVAEFIKFSEDNQALQYKDQMAMIDANISTVYGVPDIKLGLVTAGKVANPDMQLTTYYDVIGMGHETIAAKINAELLPLLGITKSVVAFNSPQEEDMFRMITMGKMGVDSRLFSINEWRMMMDFPPVPWGDKPSAGASSAPIPPPNQVGEPDQVNNDPEKPDALDEEDEESEEEGAT